MVGCYVKGCETARPKIIDENVAPEKVPLQCPLFRFPKDPVMVQKWLDALSVYQTIDSNCPKTSLICKKHFKDDCFQPKAGFSDVRLTKEAVPSVFPAHQITAISTDTSLIEGGLIFVMPEAEPELEPETITRRYTVIRYPSDLSEDVLDRMSPDELKSAIRLLKRACRKKDAKINALRASEKRDKMKVKSLCRLIDTVGKNMQHGP